MGKNKDDSEEGRREPYNQPIRIYGVPNLRGISAKQRWHYHDVEIGLRVASEIVRAREAAKMTQGELARALKTKRAMVSSIESDARSITVGMLARIACALKCGLEIRIIAGLGGTEPGLKMPRRDGFD